MKIIHCGVYNMKKKIHDNKSRNARKKETEYNAGQSFNSAEWNCHLSRAGRLIMTSQGHILEKLRKK